MFKKLAKFKKKTFQFLRIYENYKLSCSFFKFCNLKKALQMNFEMLEKESHN